MRDIDDREEAEGYFDFDGSAEFDDSYDLFDDYSFESDFFRDDEVESPTLETDLTAPLNVKDSVVSFDVDPFAEGPFDQALGNGLFASDDEVDSAEVSDLPTKDAPPEDYDPFDNDDVFEGYSFDDGLEDEFSSAALTTALPRQDAPAQEGASQGQVRPVVEHGGRRNRKLLVVGVAVLIAGCVALGAATAHMLAGRRSGAAPASVSSTSSSHIEGTTAQIMARAKTAARAIESSRALSELEASVQERPSAEQMYARNVAQVAIAPGLTFDGSRIPIQVSGIMLDGNPASLVTFVNYDGGGLALPPGNYKIRVVGSPVAADGTVYEVSEKTSIVHVGTDGDTFWPTFALPLKAVDAANVSNEYLEWVLAWLAADSARADSYARLSEAARSHNTPSAASAPSNATPSETGAANNNQPGNAAQSQQQQHEQTQTVAPAPAQPEQPVNEEAPTTFNIIIFENPEEENVESEVVEVEPSPEQSSEAQEIPGEEQADGQEPGTDDSDLF